ncbi:MAG: DUF2782 domain-containing protein [Pseudomonadota bacterium]
MNMRILQTWALLLVLAPLLGQAQPASEAQNDGQPGGPVTEDAPPPPLPALKSAPKPDPNEAPIGDVPIPPKVRNSQEIVPAVRITTGDDGQIIEEYSSNGEIYMVKVTPKKGPPYYFFDYDGDGIMETRQFESDSGVKPVHWKLLEWE